MICNCNMAWGSILPQPPCPTHGSVNFNIHYSAPKQVYTIREERYFVVERGEPEGDWTRIPTLKETVGTFDTLREAEAVRDALSALNK